MKVIKKNAVLTANRMITPLQTIMDGAIIISDGKISSIGQKKYIQIPEDAEVIDFGDRIIAPGFVDIHIHGALGCFAQDNPEAAIKIADFISKNGTTSFLPTIQSADGIKNVAAAKRQQENEPVKGAEIAGLHMEIPFLLPGSLKNSRYQDDEIKNFSIFEIIRQYYNDSEGLLKIMGLSIEIDGVYEIIRELKILGILPAAINTKSTYEQFQKSAGAGIKHLTHINSITTGLNSRSPGLVGGALTNDHITCELIGDGIHVHPALMDILIRCKGPDKVALITDLTIGGLPDGDYGMVIIKNGTPKIKGIDDIKENTIAGSMHPLNLGVRNVTRIGYPLNTAVRMASLTPAQIAGIDKVKGSLESGKDADIIVIDDNINIYMAMVKGNIVYIQDGNNI